MTYGGKKLLFALSVLAKELEWAHPLHHVGVNRWVRDLLPSVIHSQFFRFADIQLEVVIQALFQVIYFLQAGRLIVGDEAEQYRFNSKFHDTIVAMQS